MLWVGGDDGGVDSGVRERADGVDCGSGGVTVLDLFCKAGGASMLLRRVWRKALIVGLDIEPQPRPVLGAYHRMRSVRDVLCARIA